jgi:uncharacterized protein (DUF2132 family)
MSDTQKQLIRIANEHGFKAEPTLSGSVVVMIPYTENGKDGVENFYVYNLNSLKRVLGYFGY